MIESVQIGDRDLVDAVDHRRVTRRHRVEPAAAAFAPGGRAEFPPQS